MAVNILEDIFASGVPGITALENQIADLAKRGGTNAEDALRLQQFTSLLSINVSITSGTMKVFSDAMQGVVQRMT